MSERDEFEAAMRELSPTMDAFRLRRAEPDGYMDSRIHFGWQAWQAARRASPAPTTETQVFVPPTPRAARAASLAAQPPAVGPTQAIDLHAAILSTVRSIVRHWDEFGPEHGFDEVIDNARRHAVAELASAATDPWHAAVLQACFSIDGGYVEADPAATLRHLIDWHVRNAPVHQAVTPAMNAQARSPDKERAEAKDAARKGVGNAGY